MPAGISIGHGSHGCRRRPGNNTSTSTIGTTMLHTECRVSTYSAQGAPVWVPGMTP